MDTGQSISKSFTLKIRFKSVFIKYINNPQPSFSKFNTFNKKFLSLQMVFIFIVYFKRERYISSESILKGYISIVYT